MQMEPQVSLNCEGRLHPESILIRDGNDGETPSSQDHAAPQQTVKKQTRQWAAWTRQEEESFFTALRQVGKNFEKITCRVQSKNKDQVRHYYYRLVRRMNKLLGPELCLDAKNSKDTNAAMLRWWSLLEKYSCKASKLHLKPRRFKIFIETLEHQLLKDRKKNIRKRPSQGENCPPSAHTTVSNQGKTSGHDSHAVKVVLVDGHNIQKLGPGKSSLRRNVNLNINHSNCKGDSSSVRAVRQRRKAGTVSTAAYKRWEKAAIAGVSLVADAAEHLERSATDREFEHVQNPLRQKVLDPVGKDFPPMPTFSKNLFLESNTQTSMKLKLQLFPIDDGTRRTLELENHNPHLELTLSSRKKISSVLEHLNRKWGNSSIASGELLLFPYCAQRENLVGFHRWTLDSMLCAADVFALIGSPPVFRLRYGWFSHTELESTTLQAPLASCSILGEHNMHPTNTKEQIVDSLPVPTPPLADHQPEKRMDPYKDKHISVTENTDVTSSTDLHGEIVECTDPDPNNKILESSNRAPTISLHGRETGTGAITRQREIMDDMRLHNALSAVEWADSLTNISVGDLLSEVSRDMDSNCIDPVLPGSSQCLPQIPFSCDSFDAAIAAHIYRDQDNTGFQPALASHMSSIWDAEETCDAFSFQKINVFNKEIQSASQFTSLEASKEIARISSERSGAAIEELVDVERPMDDNPAHGDPVDDDTSHGDPLDDDPAHADPMDECQPDSHTLDNSSEDLNGLTDIYWPDSLGPLDLDLPSCRYHSEDLILSDSLSGMNRLIASSLDAFQNCSFFGLDKKESASKVEARETVSFSDYKIGSEV